MFKIFIVIVMFTQELNNWEIESIIPVEVAKRHADVIINEYHKEEDFIDYVETTMLNNPNYWSSEKEYDEVGARFTGAYRFQSEGAFGDWVLCRSNRTSPYVWNNKTKQRIYIDEFTIYVLIREFQIHKFNSLHINALDGGVYKLNKETGNTEKFINGKLVEIIPPLGKIY